MARAMPDREPSPDRPARRRLLIGGLGLAGAYAGVRLGLPALSERFGSLSFEPLERPPGFRRLVADGGISARGFDPFLGIDAPADPVRRVVPSCEGLFDPGATPGTVPIAYFSDYNCAYCRILAPRLAVLDRVSVTLHELPLLGEGSVAMARAALAAGEQGAHRPFHDALLRIPRPSPSRISRIVADLDLDPARLQADLDAPTVRRSLDRSRAVAALFGIYATPSMIVGRTLVIGAASDVILDRLVERERAEGPIPSCR